MTCNAVLICRLTQAFSSGCEAAVNEQQAVVETIHGIPFRTTGNICYLCISSCWAGISKVTT